MSVYTTDDIVAMSRVRGHGSVDVGLHSDEPTLDNELTGSRYRRMAVPAESWGRTADGRYVNRKPIAWPRCPPDGVPWGDVTHVAIYRSGTDEVISSAPIAQGKVRLYRGDKVVIHPGHLTVDRGRRDGEHDRIY